MNSPLRAVLFDIDGTLIDTISLIVEALDYTYQKHLGFSGSYEEIKNTIGTPLSAQMHYFDDKVTKPVNYVQMAADHIEYYEANQHRETLITNAIDCVKICKEKGYFVGLVTSKNLSEMDCTMPRLGLENEVHVVVTADDVENPKPAPDPIILALAKLKIQPHEAIYVGDTTYDISCAKDANVAVAAVTWGAHSRSDLINAKPDHLFDTPAQLRDYILQLPEK